MEQMTGARMVHVPHKGGDAAAVSPAAGETQAMIATMPVVKPLLAGNRVRVLAVTSDTREQFALRLTSDYDKYAKLIALIGAKVD